MITQAIIRSSVFALVVAIITLFTPSTSHAKDVDFSGVWDTVWSNSRESARLEIVQKKDKAWGSYSYKGGKISGVIIDNTFQGTWAHKDGPSGNFIFTLSRDGRSFSGRWRYGQKGDWQRDPWNGVRRW